MATSITPINVASVSVGQTLGPFDISQQYIRPTPQQTEYGLTPKLVLINDTGVQVQVTMGGGNQVELPPGGWTDPIFLADSDTTFKLYVRGIIPNQVITQITGTVYAPWEIPTGAKTLGNSPTNISNGSLTVTPSGPVTVQTGANPLIITPSGTVTIQENGPLTIIGSNPGGSANQQRVVAVPIGVQQFFSGNWGPTVGNPTLDIIRPLVSAANIANNKVSCYFYAGQMSFVLTSGGAMEFKLSVQCEDVSFNKLGSPVEMWHSICSYSASPLNQVISTFCPAEPLCFTISPLPANTHFVVFFLTAINGTFPGTLAGTISADIDQGNAFPNPDIGNFGAYGGIVGTLF